MTTEIHRRPAEFAYLSYHLMLVEGVAALGFAFLSPASVLPALAAVPMQAMAIAIAGSHPSVSGHLAVGGLWTFCVATAATSGGSSSPAIAALVAVPVLATLLVRGRGTVLWALASVAAAIGLSLAAVQSSIVHPPPPGVAADVMRLFVLGMLTLTLTRAVFQLISDARVAFRDLELSNRKLQDAIETTQMHSRAKSSFLASMSHELRTPMNGVVGIAGLLLRTDLLPEQREHVNTIRSSGEALLTIINDVLDFSRVEAGMITVETSPCDLRVMMREVSSLLDVGASAKGVRLHTQVDGNVPVAVLTDSGRLRQILMNIVGNAVKFTQQGRVEVHIQASEVDDTAANITFQVADTGCGIPAHALPSLFKRYVRARTVKTRALGGTGLGLAISKALVDLLGGTITVESTEGVGTTMTICMTMPVTQAIEPTRPERFESALFHAHVLLADDNVINQKVAEAMLHRMGCTVDIVDNGQSAVEHTTRKHYDIVLMDCEMPELDGFEATQAIRLTHNPVPIVALTAHVLDSIRSRAINAGMDAFITKPYTMEQLGRLLAEHCPSTMRPPTPQGAQGSQSDYVV